MAEPTPKELQAWICKQFGEKVFTEGWCDHWGIIVKLHAMIETGLNGAIVRELQKPELADAIAKLDTSNTATGKIAFAKALGILEKKSCTFIIYLSRLRNKCVHDVRNFSFDLDHFLTTDKDANEYINAIGKMVKDPYFEAGLAENTLIRAADSVMTELFHHDAKCQQRDEASQPRAPQESTPKES